MTNLWVTFSTDISGSFTEISGNIIYNLNNIYNFNGNVIDTTSNFIIYELSNNPIQSGIPLQASNWNQLSLNTILSPFQGYWLGQINTILPVITSESIFLDYDLHTHNLGVRWIITDLLHLTHGNGGDIPGDKEFTTDITYTGILEIDVNNIPDIYTSYTNSVYLDTTVTITETSQSNVYNIIFVWNGLTRTIENVTIL